MGDEKSESDLNALRSLVGLPEEKLAEPTPFAKSVATALTKALAAMRESGMIEVEDANLDALISQVVDAALESSTLKRLPLRIVKTLIHSDLVEEVFGTDAEIGEAIRPFLEEL